MFAKQAMKNSAESRGISWDGHVQQLMQRKELEAIKSELEKDVTYPSYYLQPFHACGFHPGSVHTATPISTTESTHPWRRRKLELLILNDHEILRSPCPFATNSSGNTQNYRNQHKQQDPLVWYVGLFHEHSESSITLLASSFYQTSHCTYCTGNGLYRYTASLVSCARMCVYTRPAVKMAT